MSVCDVGIDGAVVIVQISRIQELSLKWENDDNVNLVIIKV
jgi:hypothetical protein